MEKMNHTNPVSAGLASVFGLVGGVITFLKIHLGFGTDVSPYVDKFISFMGALIIAFMSGFVGYAGGMLAKKLFGKKR